MCRSDGLWRRLCNSWTKTPRSLLWRSKSAPGTCQCSVRSTWSLSGSQLGLARPKASRRHSTTFPRLEQSFSWHQTSANSPSHHPSKLLFILDFIFPETNQLVVICHLALSMQHSWGLFHAWISTIVWLCGNSFWCVMLCWQNQFHESWDDMNGIINNHCTTFTKTTAERLHALRELTITSLWIDVCLLFTN